MQPFFNRHGNKKYIADKIIKMFPKDYDIYVEPFCGSAAVYFQKQPSRVEVLNDKDSELIKGYRLIKQVSTNLNEYKQLKSLAHFRRFYDESHNSKEEQLEQLLLKFNNTFLSSGRGKLYKTTNPFSKLEVLSEYKERLKHTTILNWNYQTVIRKYDSPRTLFYLDPPYENSSSGNYAYYDMDYHELAEILSQIKGYFILSINDSPNIRTIFKAYRMIQITLQSYHNIIPNRRELLILNY